MKEKNIALPKTCTRKCNHVCLELEALYQQREKNMKITYVL